MTSARTRTATSRVGDWLIGLGRIRWAGYSLEWLVLVVIVVLYARVPLLERDSGQLQQSFEHNEAVTLHLLTEHALRAGVLPLWNPYMSSGFPVAGDFVSVFWNPVSTIPVALFGGIDGYKIAAFCSLLVAGLGQWALGLVVGLRWPLRLWSAALLMLSGAMALFWFLGWHQLLVGLSWFPACFAALIWALRSPRRASVGLAAVPIAAVCASSGGYYLLYLGVCLVALTTVLVAVAGRADRRRLVGRAGMIAVLAIALSAVVWLPATDVLTHTVRQAPRDELQAGSQPIAYALVNYVVADRSWFNGTALGQLPASAWMYVGALPLFGLVGVPLAFDAARRRTAPVLGLIGLLVLLLAWHANRHTPIGWIYDSVDILSTFRFPARLLAVATIPLIALGALGLQALIDRAVRRVRRSRMPTTLPMLTVGVAAAVLLASAADVFRVNQHIAFDELQKRSRVPTVAFEWLQQHDPGLYSVQAGDWRIRWNWTPAAYEARVPMLNFAYNRHTESFLRQQDPAAIVRATPRYLFPWDGETPPRGRHIATVGDVPLYEDVDALPYAFTVVPAALSLDRPLGRRDVTAASAEWLNPNELEVRLDGTAGDQLVVLVSAFPGWRVYLDGERVGLEHVNEYLATRVVEGTHTYRFAFEPPKLYAGLAISASTLVFVLWLVLTDVSAARRSRSGCRPG